MSLPLLSTKFFPPSPGTVALPRARLAARLDDAGDRPLSLVVAPAGYGKTTLVTSWLGGRDEPYAWLSLDPADDEPQRFWSYVVRALARLDAEATAEADARLDAPEFDADAVVASLLNGFSAPSARGGRLVLDDLHVLEDPAVQRSLADFVERLPERLRVLVLSRADPALPIGRLRARGRVGELRQADLRFSEEEVRDFLDAHALGIAPDVAARLGERTEGWAASLQLATLSLERLDPDRRAAFVRDFSGNDRFVVDYLVDEVLQTRSAEEHDFLLATSVLDRLSTDACAVVCDAAGLDGPRPALESLERAGLFVLPLDRERRWYRYHHLFAELLRIRAARRFDVERLTTAAGRWFGVHQDVEEGMDLALRVGRTDVAREILEEGFGRMLGHGSLAALRRAVARLPTDRVEGSVSLCIAMAYVEHLSSGLTAGRVWADRVRRHVEEGTSDPEFHDAGHLAVFDGIRAAAESDPEAGRDAIRRAYAAFADVRDMGDFMTTVVEQLEAIMMLAHGRLDDAVRIGTSAWRRGVDSGNCHAGASGLQAAGAARAATGEVERALRQLDEALAVESRDAGHPIVVAFLQIRRADLLLCTGRIEDATEALRAARSATEIGGTANTRALLLGEEIRAALVVGDASEAAEDALRLLDLLDRESVWVMCTPRLQEVAAAALLAGGRTRELADRLTTVADAGTDRGWAAHEALLRARVRLAAGDLRGAETAADDAARTAERLGAPLWADEARVFRAMVLERLRDGRATEVLLEAFPGIRRRDHRLPFLLAGPETLPVLSRALAADPSRVDAAWVATVTATLEQLRAGEDELLSEREAEVLAFLDAGLTNRAIAERLFLSVGTVKKHTHNIYTKLEVSRRTEAVKRARELGLLE